MLDKVQARLCAGLRAPTPCTAKPFKKKRVSARSIRIVIGHKTCINCITGGLICEAIYAGNLIGIVNSYQVYLLYKVMVQLLHIYCLIAIAGMDQK